MTIEPPLQALGNWWYVKSPKSFNEIPMWISWSMYFRDFFWYYWTLIHVFSCIFAIFLVWLAVDPWMCVIFLVLLDYLPPILPCVTLWETNIAIENGHRNSWFTHEKLSFSIVFSMLTRGYTMLSIPSGKPTVCYGKSQCLISIHSGTLIYIYIYV